MYKIKNNRRFNTAAATPILKAGEFNPEDPYSVEETLYRKKRTGEYFIAGKGGGETKYAVRAPDGSTIPGEDANPVSLEVARQWIKTHVPKEDPYEIIPEPGEDEKMGVNVIMPKNLISKIEEEAKLLETSRSNLIRTILTDYFK